MPEQEIVAAGPVVRVSSHAKVEVPADRASLTVQVSSGVRRIKEEAIAEVNLQREDVQRVLAEVADFLGHVATGRNSVSEVTRYNREGQPIEEGQPRWRADVSLEIEITEVAGVPELYNRLRRLAPAYLGGPYWSLSDDHPAHGEARAAAVRLTIDRARQMASAAGSTVVALDWLADADAGEPERFRSMVVAGASPEDAFGEDVDVEPAPQTVTASVRAQYRIRPVTYGD